jgi:ABC-type transport system involved in multi-copper enzyme maturation permease subunit
MSTAHDTPAESGRSQIQRGAALVGAVFLLVGVLGFVPGITSSFSQLRFASQESAAQLLGIFQVSVLHNLVHLAFGVLGLVLARRSPLAARNFLLYGGLVYLLLFFYGVVIEYKSAANFVPFDDADNVLHLVLAAGMATLSVVLDRGRAWRRTVADGKATL